MSRWTSMVYGARGRTILISFSCSFFTSILRDILPSVALSSRAWPNSQSEGSTIFEFSPAALTTRNSSNSYSLVGRVFWMAARVNWQSLTNCWCYVIIRFAKALEEFSAGRAYAFEATFILLRGSSLTCSHGNCNRHICSAFCTAC